MHVETYVVPRNSSDELTYAAVRVQFSEEAVAAGRCVVSEFLTLLQAAVTQWVKTTEEGRKAWEDSSEDFNIGDLANCDLGSVNRFLALRGIWILDIDVHSMDGPTHEWAFDTVLVDAEALNDSPGDNA